MNEHTTREEAIRIAEANREQRKAAERRNEIAAQDIGRLWAENDRLRKVLRDIGERNDHLAVFIDAVLLREPTYDLVERARTALDKAEAYAQQGQYDPALFSIVRAVLAGAPGGE